MIPQEQFNNFYENLITDITKQVEQRVLQNLKNTIQAEDEQLTPEEVAEHLHIDKTTVYDMLREGQIGHVRVGKLRSKRPAIRIPRSELNLYIQRQLEEVTK